MNLWAPGGNQGAVYGLDTSVNAAARSLAPMVGATATIWFGLRGVFGATTLVYVGIVLVGVFVLRLRAQARPVLEVGARPVGDD